MVLLSLRLVEGMMEAKGLRLRDYFSSVLPGRRVYIEFIRCALLSGEIVDRREQVKKRLYSFAAYSMLINFGRMMS